MGRHLQGKAGPQHRCLCGPRKPGHRFSQTLQMTVKAWRGRGEQEAPSTAVHTVYHLPTGKGPEDARWGRWGGGQSHGPTAAPPLSPGIKAFTCGGRAESRVQSRRANPRGWGRGAQPSKPPPGLTCPISPRTRALGAHSQTSDQECRKEVWRCSGVRSMVTEAI